MTPEKGDGDRLSTIFCFFGFSREKVALLCLFLFVCLFVGVCFFCFLFFYFFFFWFLFFGFWFFGFLVLFGILESCGGVFDC